MAASLPLAAEQPWVHHGHLGLSRRRRPLGPHLGTSSGDTAGGALGRGDPGWIQQEPLGMATRHAAPEGRALRQPGVGTGLQPPALWSRLGPGPRRADGGGRVPLLGVHMRT